MPVPRLAAARTEPACHEPVLTVSSAGLQMILEMVLLSENISGFRFGELCLLLEQGFCSQCSEKTQAKMGVLSCFCPPCFFSCCCSFCSSTEEGADSFLSCLGRCTLSTTILTPSHSRDRNGMVVPGLCSHQALSAEHGEGHAGADHLGIGQGGMAFCRRREHR